MLNPPPPLAQLVIKSSSYTSIGASLQSGPRTRAVAMASAMAMSVAEGEPRSEGSNIALKNSAMSLWKWLSPSGKKPEDCPFCILASGSVEGRTPNVLFQDEQIVVFADRNPSTYRHYLVIPTNHIKTVKTLHPGEADFALVSHMLKIGQSILKKDAPNASNYRFGFHRPPFNSVDHLHLHCMALPYTSPWRRFKYVSLGWWGAYISAEHVLQYLNPARASKSEKGRKHEPEMPV